MEYPGTHFTRQWRQAMLFGFILIFLLIAPLVILTTAGYKMDWNSRWLSFRGTGSLSIDIRPTNATVYLNGIRLLGSMPYRLNSLTPDNQYTLKITAPGYYDWQKDIPIRSNETFYLKDIAMLKKTSPTLIATGTIPYISLSPNNQKLLFTIDFSTTTQLWALNIDSGEKKLVSNFNRQTNLQISWSTNGSFALFKFFPKDLPSYHQIFSNETNIVTPLLQVFGTEPTKTEWNKTSEPEIYASVSTTLFSYRPISESVLKVGILPSPTWHVDQGHVSTLTVSSTTKNIILTNDVFGFPNVITTISPSELEYSTHGDWDIAGNIGKIFLLKSDKNKTIKIISYNKIYNVPATDFIVSNFNSWLIMWNNTEITTFTSGDEPKLLNRSGEYLKNLIPLDEYNTLALSWKNKTTVLYPYYLISHEFLPEITAMATNPKNRNFYFSAKFENQSGLWQISY